MNKKNFLLLYGGALAAWLLPMAIGSFMVVPETHEYRPNYIVFKLTMFMTVSVVIFLAYRSLYRLKLLTIKVPIIFLLTSTILDMVVLIGLFGMGLDIWGLHIFPLYLLAFFGLYIAIKKL